VKKLNRERVSELREFILLYTNTYGYRHTFHSSPHTRHTTQKPLLHLIVSHTQIALQ